MKWRFLLKSILNFENNNKVMRSLFVGLSSGIFTPFRVGEYYGRSLDITGSTVSEVAALTVLDKLFVVVTIAVIGGAFFLFFISNLNEVNPVIKYVIGFFILCILFIPFILIKLKGSKLFYLLRKIKIVSTFIDRIASLKKFNVSIAIKTFFFTVLVYIIYTLQYSILISAFSESSVLSNNYFFTNVVMFSKAMIPQISFGELGVRESTSIFYSSYFNLTSVAVFNASILIFVINLLVPAVIGFFFITKKSK